jgi:hypothetical protein
LRAKAEAVSTGIGSSVVRVTLLMQLIVA